MTTHEVSHYNVSDKVLEGAFVDSFDVLTLFTGKMVVRTRLHLVLGSLEGPQLTQPSGSLSTYTSLSWKLPQESETFGVPPMSVSIESPESVSPDAFVQDLNTAVDELIDMELTSPDAGPKQTPVLMIRLLHHIVSMNLDQVKLTFQELFDGKQKDVAALTPKEQVYRCVRARARMRTYFFSTSGRSYFVCRILFRYFAVFHPLRQSPFAK